MTAMRYVFISENEHQVQECVGQLCVPVGQKIYTAALSHEIEPLLARGSIPPTATHQKPPPSLSPTGVLLMTVLPQRKAFLPTPKNSFKTSLIDLEP